MDKMKMHTPNKADENYAKLAAMFPNAVTETINENGEIVRAIDKDVLMQEISCKVVEGREERYQFTWPDKRKSLLLANAPISKTLRPCREESVDFDTTENLYIEGDNLEVLKLLQETYLGKIKMIYIDPPYNTGNDFVYEDNFAQSTEDYIANSGQFDKDGNRLVSNTESNGRFHTDWLNMMYPRIRLAKDLLTNDGIIFISIDDNELENLIRICDDIFGASNRIGELIWQSATDNNPRQITIEHEYVLCYGKNTANLTSWQISSEKARSINNQYKELKKQYEDIDVLQQELRKWIKANQMELKGVAHYNNVDKIGVYSNSSNSSNTKPGGYTFDIIHPITKKPCVKPAFGWRWTEQTFWNYDKVGDIEWGKDETTQPHVKKRIETVTELLKSIYYEDGRVSTKQLEILFGKKKIFDNPKTTTLIERLMRFSIKDDDAIILDFFSGSATTANAVMNLNAEDGGKRKFIMVQLPEEINEKSEAYKAGYKNICQIGKERIRRTAKKIAEDNPDISFDKGFRVLKCDSSNMKDVYYNPVEYQPTLFSSLSDNIKEDRTPEDLLFQVMLDLGVELSSSIEDVMISGKKVFNVANGFLIACFDENVNGDTITEIAKKKPYYFVMRDNSMANDSVATNFDQLFATYSPDTIRKVL